MTRSIATPVRGAGSVSGDTHAANLTGTQTQSVQTCNNAQKTLAANSTTTIDTRTFTPAASAVAVALFFVKSAGASGATWTYRVKRGSTTLSSVSGDSSGENQISVLAPIDTGFTPNSSTTWTCEITTDNNNGITLQGGLVCCEVDDNHAASLTGSAGSCV